MPLLGSRGGSRILIPADAATALVLRMGITDTPSIEELKALALPVEELIELPAEHDLAPPRGSTTDL